MDASQTSLTYVVNEKRGSSNHVITSSLIVAEQFLQQHAPQISENRESKNFRVRNLGIV
ncbi:hypothetical protein KIN20_012833 [Parelaphostrongylus tenuis]|uniref:Uncharacterized protein n=1 Tax=Parelaphostrongylus tenuis TaxID=148309 RepID=A0AAD5QQP6_PARTN|nr:hypothetical protein KIN20_012833 [Parelaphostrongylus tenuis]